MKKNNVSIDFVAFGDLQSETMKKLESFNENIKGGEGSHVEFVQPGPNLLSDRLVSTPILAGEGSGPRGGEDAIMGGTDGGGAGYEFGVDPSTDPELALALRMSMEEEKARQEREGKAQGEESKEPMEGIPEEATESQPLLDQSGEPSGSGEASKAEGDKPKEEKKDGEGDNDKMDTA